MLMPTERRRAPRYPFIARAEIIDEKENARTSSRVSDLSVHGCYVEMMNPFPEGTTVVIEIYTETESLEAHGTVARIEPKRGMGLSFDELAPSFAGVLNKWVDQAHGRKAN
jgi:PilZ domain